MTAAGQRPLPRPDATARRQLAELLAGARDLDGDNDSSIELARHLRDQRAAAGKPVDVDAVLLDLEACLRAQPPPLDDTIRMPRLTGTALDAAVQRARAEFDRRFRQHLAFARAGLEGR
jgi:hypothetical protein